MAKLGDTVSVRVRLPFDPSVEMYWDSLGRPCDRHGQPLGVDKRFYITLDTPEKVAAYNATGEILLDGFTGP